MNAGETQGPRVTQAERELGLRPGSFPFESRFQPVAGARLHYVDEGHGPTLFMLHGNPTWSFLYRKLILELRDRFRCVALDLPGFGLSQTPPDFGYRAEKHAQFVAGFLRALDLRNATLIAHDWGGPIGLGAAFRTHRRLIRFVLGNTWAWPVNGDWHFEWFSRFFGGPIGRLLMRQANFFPAVFLPMAVRRARLPADVRAAYRAPFALRARREGPHRFPREILAARTFLDAVHSNLHRLSPEQMLFLWPERDIAFRQRELERWLRLFPGAPCVRIPRCGHYPWEEAPADCVRAIESFLIAAGDSQWRRQCGPDISAFARPEPGT